MPTSRTKPSTPRLSDLARHVKVPSGIVSTAWPSVVAKCAELGIGFDFWQHGTGKIILAKRESGLYAAGIGGVVISIPRQVGKTYLIGAIVFALCLLHPNLTVIWTAHRLRTANETFRSMQGLTRRSKIKPHILKVVLGSGEEEVQFRNGSRILFGARERGFGVGFAEVDVLVLDEAQRATNAALDDLIPTTNQSRHPAGPLVLMMGTPPRKTDPGEVFRQKRKAALANEEQDGAYIEFGADPDAGPDDWAQVRKANPSHPKRTPREAILRMRRNLTAESFLLEGMGIWPEDARPSELPDWPACVTTDPPPTRNLTIGIAVDLDLEWACLGAAALRDDGKVHVSVPEDEIGRVDHARGTAWLIPRAKELQDRHDCNVLIDEKCPDADLADRLRKAGVTVTELKMETMLDACSGLITAVVEGTVTHFNQPDLNTARLVVGKRLVTERPLWARKSGDITPVEAITIARHGALNQTEVWEVWT